jgi:hypothetical protein
LQHTDNKSPDTPSSVPPKSVPGIFIIIIEKLYLLERSKRNPA